MGLFVNTYSNNVQSVVTNLPDLHIFVVHKVNEVGWGLFEIQLSSS